MSLVNKLVSKAAVVRNLQISAGDLMLKIP